MNHVVELSVLLRSRDSNVVVRKHLDMSSFEAVQPVYQLDALREAVMRQMHKAMVDVFDQLAAQHLPEQLVRIYHPRAVVESQWALSRDRLYQVMSDQPPPINMDPSEAIKQPVRALLGLGLTEREAWRDAWARVTQQRGVKAWDAMRSR